MSLLNCEIYQRGQVSRVADTELILLIAHVLVFHNGFHIMKNDFHILLNGMESDGVCNFPFDLQSN